jgi:hypothetical protein
MGEQPATVLALKLAFGWANKLQKGLTDIINNNRQPVKPHGLFFIGMEIRSQKRYWYFDNNGFV